MKKKIAAGILCLVFLALAMSRIEYKIERENTQQEIAKKVLRFHVRANSDTKEDQALKLKVRDAIGEEMSGYMERVTDLDDCRSIVGGHMKEIVKTAEEVIAAEGYTYPVEAYVADVDFPDKTYGEYTFPAGSYEALEVVIGSGTGHNWWCVMYPNMCFSGSGYEIVEKDAKQSLRHTLSEEEYKTLMEEKNYTVKCKYLTFLNPCLEKLQEKVTETVK